MCYCEVIKKKCTECYIVYQKCITTKFSKNAQEFISEECTTVNVFCSYIFVCCNSINMYEYLGCYGYIAFNL